MTWSALRSIDGRLVVQRPDGQAITVHEDGVPVRPLLPGWVCDGVVHSFAPIHLVALRSVTGLRAVWVLDHDMRRIPGDVRSIPEPLLSALCERATELFRLLNDRVLAPLAPTALPALAGLELLPDDVIGALVSLAMDDLTADMRVVALPGAPEHVFGFVTERLRATLQGDIRDGYRDLLAGRGMGCLTPDTGRRADAQLGMVMPDRSTMYRFPSSFMGAFYVTTRDYYDRKFAFYVPHARLYVMGDYAPEPRVFLSMLLVHAARHQARLCRLLATPRAPMRPANLVSDYPLLHIGHVIWNDLTGLQALADTLPRDALPEVVVINPTGGSEPFGPVEALFPEFTGRVRRPSIEWEDAAAYLYDNALFPMRFKLNRVPRSVRDRVQALADADPRLADDRALADRMASGSVPCMLLGLRVGNRTLQNQVESLVGVIEHLVFRLGRVLIVVDGINSRLGIDPTTSHGSFGPPGGGEPLIEELGIVFALRRRFSREGVTIVGTVGCPVASSLFWARKSSFFVAPWGAALAKYRWICNLPGFVLTNRFMIGQPVADLPIYHDAAYLEDPSEMRIVAIEHVTDAPGPSGFYANFDVAPGAIRDGLDGMIALTGLRTMTD